MAENIQQHNPVLMAGLQISFPEASLSCQPAELSLLKVDKPKLLVSERFEQATVTTRSEECLSRFSQQT